MGLFDSIFGASGTADDMKRRQWNPLAPRPLYDWEQIVDGKIVNKATGKPEAGIAKSVVEKAAQRAAFMPPSEGKPTVKRRSIFDRLLSGIETGQ